MIAWPDCRFHQNYLYGVHKRKQKAYYPLEQHLSNSVHIEIASYHVSSSISDSSLLQDCCNAGQIRTFTLARREVAKRTIDQSSVDSDGREFSAQMSDGISVWMQT